MALYHRIQSLDDSVNPLPAALLSNLCALPWLRPAGKESPSPGWDKSHRLDLHGRGFANLSSTCFLPVWGGGDSGSLLQSGVTICGMEKLSVIRIFPQGLSDSLWRVFLYCDTTDLSPKLYLSSPRLDHSVPGSLPLSPPPRSAHPPTARPSRAVSLCSPRFWVCFCFCLSIDFIF